MRRARRFGHGGAGEFASSGEDSFVAVVVTKLTGALLFILLLTMVIMALLPKAIELPSSESKSQADSAALEIQTPERLPEAIAGRPYALALAATGGNGPVSWAIDGELPKGLTFDPAKAQIAGTPATGTPRPAQLVLRCSDGSKRAVRSAELVVYQSDRPLTLPSRWKPGLPPIPWRAWLEQGFGFLILALVHTVGMNTVAGLERWSAARQPEGSSAEDLGSVQRRFALYRALVRLASLAAVAGLAFWLWSQRPSPLS